VEEDQSTVQSFATRVFGTKALAADNTIPTTAIDVIGWHVDLVAETIRPNDKGIRKLTPRECFNLQGFPSSYKLPELSDCNLYKLAGNAVSVPVVKLIADRIIPLLQEDI
jgi:site-specific DNA-cytosine methylase